MLSPETFYFLQQSYLKNYWGYEQDSGLASLMEHNIEVIYINS